MAVTAERMIELLKLIDGLTALTNIQIKAIKRQMTIGVKN